MSEVRRHVLSHVVMDDNHERALQLAEALKGTGDVVEEVIHDVKEGALFVRELALRASFHRPAALWLDSVAGNTGAKAWHQVLQRAHPWFFNLDFDEETGAVVSTPPDPKLTVVVAMSGELEPAKEIASNIQDSPVAGQLIVEWAGNEPLNLPLLRAAILHARGLDAE